jgi:hypothetical protein
VRTAAEADVASAEGTWTEARKGTLLLQSLSLQRQKISKQRTPPLWRIHSGWMSVHSVYSMSRLLRMREHAALRIAATMHTPWHDGF